MKKSLIALAAMAAVGAASAQSSVTLYGIIDTGVGYSSTRWKNNAGGEVKNTSSGFNSGNLSGSRWGLRGQEDLGNGLAAVFNIESGFNSATGAKANGNFNRRSVVGLRGGFGQVLLGTDYTPVDRISGDYVAVGINEGDYYTARATGIHYSGTFSGVSIAAFAGGSNNKTSVTQNGVETVPTTVTQNSAAGLGLGYAQDAFSVYGAVQVFKANGGARNTEYGVGASYDFTSAQLFAHYLGNKPKGSKSDHQIGVGVAVPLGSLTLSAQYAYNRFRAGRNVGVTALDNNGNYSNAALARMAAVGGTAATGFRGNGHDFALRATYAFSNRTDAYAQYSFRSLKGKTVNNDTTWQGMKMRNNAFNVGLRHRF